MSATARKQWNVRISPELWDQADARRQALGLSRDAWTAKLIEWAVTQPLPTEQDA